MFRRKWNNAELDVVNIYKKLGCERIQDSLLSSSPSLSLFSSLLPYYYLNGG